MALAPKFCKVEEIHDHYFVSPSKIVIMTKITNSGIKFSDCFHPMIYTTLEQKIDTVNKKFSVVMTTKMYVHFTQRVRFFKGTIEKGTYTSFEASYEEV